MCFRVFVTIFHIFRKYEYYYFEKCDNVFVQYMYTMCFQTWHNYALFGFRRKISFILINSNCTIVI